MSLFDYPRINFTGTITLNPGTANNDDYSGAFVTKDTHKNLALFDSANVQPRTYGMNDREFKRWVTHQQTFVSTTDPKEERELIPAEWNYYGDMSSDVEAKVVGVQTGPDTLYRAADGGAPLSALVGARLSLTGCITDINAEGSPPATQFFLSVLALGADGIEIRGKLSKAACQWIYFTRNVNLTGDEGAGGYMHHVARGATVTLPGIDDADIAGVVLRYYVYAKHDYETDPARIVDLYKSHSTNPAKFQITGSITPLMKDETVFTTPVGRLLIQDEPNIPTPCKNNNAGGGPLALAPAVVHSDAKRVSVDFLGSFPERYNDDKTVTWSNPTKKNPKYDFGPVTLAFTSDEGGQFDLGEVDYADTDGGNARGWVFDFDISGPEQKGLRDALREGGGAFALHHEDHGPVLTETEYFVVSNAQSIYAEQNGPGNEFVNQGYPAEAATLEVYRHGRRLTGSQAPSIKVWGYRSTPLGDSGSREVVAEALAPGEPIAIKTDKPGNLLLAFEIAGQTSSGGTGQPPETYAGYIAPPFTILANRSAISIRILPNADYSDYWEENASGELVAKDNLTFDFLYQEVLRNYYLLFPTMLKYFDLSDAAEVAAHAESILSMSDTSAWPLTSYMPITRDLSASRRTLLQAWCRKHKSKPGR